MVVWFREDPRIGVLVPERMWEMVREDPARGRPTDRRHRDAWPADLEALATYSDLRLFSVETSEEIGAPAD